jgi:hypothetical protein
VVDLANGVSKMDQGPGMRVEGLFQTTRPPEKPPEKK